MQTLWNYSVTAFVAVCLIACGVAGLWAWGAYYKVEAPKENRVLATAFPGLKRKEPIEVEEWTPITKEVDPYSRALRTLSELDRLVKEQALAIEQARKEWAMVKGVLK